MAMAMAKDAIWPTGHEAEGNKERYHPFPHKIRSPPESR